MTEQTCGSCGAALRTGARFCAVCGDPVGTGGSEVTTTAAAAAIRTVAPTPPPTTEAASVPDTTSTAVAPATAAETARPRPPTAPAAAASLVEPMAVALPAPPPDTVPVTEALPVTEAIPAASPTGSPAHAPAHDAGFGAPPAGTRGNRTRILAIAGAAVAVLALAIGVVTKIAGSDDDRTDSVAFTTTTAAAVSATTAPTTPITTATPATSAAATTPAPSASVTTPATTTPTTAATTAPPATTVPVDPRQAALSQLEALERNDRPVIDAVVVGHWVPQLSAKQEGVVWKGVSYDLPAILDEHNTLRTRYRAVVIRGSELNFNLDATWFVTLVPQPFDTGEGALAWCRDAGIDREDCFAKLVTTDLSIKRTVMSNR